jgi:phytoene dehydrogenase-like protein
VTERIIIIGGGIAGLAAGIYARRCGFETTVFEASAQPGGVVASWKRGPYLMDAGVRMIIGTAPPNPFYPLLREVGILPGAGFTRIDMLHCVESAEGQVRLYQNIEDLGRNLLEAGPRDADRIKRFLDLLTDFSRFRPNLEIEPEVFSTGNGLRSLLALGPVARHFVKFWKVSLKDWLEGFTSRQIRRAFLRIYNVEDFAVLSMFSSVGWLVAGQVSRPALGSRGVVDGVEQMYRAAGGDLQCGGRVTAILVESGRAVGVRLDDGSEHRASAVLSAADGHATLFDLLGGRYLSDVERGYYGRIPVFNPLVLIHFGAACDLGSEPSAIVFPVRKAFTVPGRRVDDLNIHITRGDGAHAPPGHCVVRLGIESDYDAWAALAGSPERYGQEKERIAREVLERLEERYPGFARAVRVSDVATPLTTERYTGNWRGAYEGWRPTTKTFGLRMKKTLPGLSRFYMAGQWVEPGGGVPAVIFSARCAIRIVCRDFRRPFTPSA